MAQTARRDQDFAAGAPRTTRPIDLVHLAKQCLGDENLEIEILRLFDTTLLTYMGRLRLATGVDDLVTALHAIKGAAGGVGAWSVSEQAQAMEGELRAGRPLRPERIEDLNIAVEEVHAFIARMLAGAAAD